MSNNNKSNLKRILKSGRAEKCEICGINSWNGNPIKLQVHHIDGNRENNSLDNLQLLCPNCHSQTDTWCSKNRSNKNKKKYFCSRCNAELNDYTKTSLCAKCYRLHEQEKSLKPSKEILKEDILSLKAYTKIGKKYGVSPTTIKKWITSYDLLNLMSS